MMPTTAIIENSQLKITSDSEGSPMVLLLKGAARDLAHGHNRD